MTMDLAMRGGGPSHKNGESANRALSANVNNFVFPGSEPAAVSSQPSRTSPPSRSASGRLGLPSSDPVPSSLHRDHEPRAFELEETGEDGRGGQVERARQLVGGDRLVAGDRLEKAP